MVYKKEKVEFYTKEDLKEIQNDKETKQKLVVDKKCRSTQKNKRREEFEKEDRTFDDLGRSTRYYWTR